jgi:hypothetical protein
MDFTYLPKFSGPEGYISPDEMSDKDNLYFLGRLLFDMENNWIYDGNKLTIAEQQSVASAILHQ